MKKHNYKISGESRKPLNEGYRVEFNASSVTTQAIEWGDGVCDYYTQVHYRVGITAELHEDFNQIVLKCAGRDFITLHWNNETTELLRNLSTMTAGEALAVLGCNAKIV